MRICTYRLRLGLSSSTLIIVALAHGTAQAQQAPVYQSPVHETLAKQAAAQQAQTPRPVVYTVGQLYDLIEAQRQQLEAQQKRIDQLEQAIQGIAGPPSYQQGQLNQSQPYQGQNAPTLTYAAQSGSEVYQQQVQNGSGAAPEEPVGEADPEAERRRIDVSGVQDIGGVLTQRNHLVLEPSLEYENSTSTRFFFDGVEIIETVLVGDIEVSDADRDTLTAAGTVRYGITNRSEIEVRVPFVYRQDDVTRDVVGAGEGSGESSLDAANIGDVEATVRYQLNSGQDDWPIFIANARVKSNTGQGPFDVDRDEDGIEEELSTGSGFWAVQPSVSVIYPSDPAVFFANVSYTHSFGYDVDEMIGESLVSDVQPGDVIGFGFGMGFALNEKASFSVGYAHDFVMETEQEIDGVTVKSDDFDVGRLALGFSYAITDSFNINLNTQIGVTEDAPDVVLTLRTPFTFDLN